MGGGVGLIKPSEFQELRMNSKLTKFGTGMVCYTFQGFGLKRDADMFSRKERQGKPSVGVTRKHATHRYIERPSWVHTELYPILCMALVSMVLLSISRILLSLWQWDQIPDGTFYIVLLQGIRVDFAAICGLYALPCLVLCLFSLIPFVTVPCLVLRLIKLYCAVGLAFIAMNELATPGFILEYGVRPNHIYVQYLMYPREVISTLWGGHKLSLILSVVFTLAVLVLGYKLASWCFKSYHQSSIPKAFVLLLLTICIVPLGIRSTFGHRPLNPAMVSFSNNALANSLPVNSSYSAVYAFLHLNDTTINESVIYKVAPDNEVLNAGLALSSRTDAVPFNEKCPFNQVVTPFDGNYGGYRMQDTFHRNTFAQTDGHPFYNVVIILEESLGDNFVGSQGGVPVTPYLEKMRDIGWWFENMYAAGHRSVRGIEAVTASMPPSPLNSIVKLPVPIHQYATLFNIFKQAGYKTSFVYGGESHFDNMRTYFLQNGMDVVIEQKDYDHPNFVASWGVSDEDLFNKANELFKAHTQKQERFFSVVFTSSFHDPFEIPAGKVDLGELKTNEPERLLAAKYADYALGKYIEQAQKEDYFENTIFLIIADHESQVRGSGIFPLNDFTIPAVIIAPNVKPHVDPRQVSQIDMGMTLMSLAGIDGEVPNVGQNLLRTDIKQRAIMQFNEIFGLLEGKRFLQISPHNQPYMFKVGDDGKLEEMPNIDQGMLHRAVALSNVGPMIYRDEYMSIDCVKLNTKYDPSAQAQAPAQSQASNQAQAEELTQASALKPGLAQGAAQAQSPAQEQAGPQVQSSTVRGMTGTHESDLDANTLALAQVNEAKVAQESEANELNDTDEALGSNESNDVVHVGDKIQGQAKILTPAEEAQAVEAARARADEAQAKAHEISTNVKTAAQKVETEYDQAAAQEKLLKQMLSKSAQVKAQAKNQNDQVQAKITLDPTEEFELEPPMSDESAGRKVEETYDESSQ